MARRLDLGLQPKWRVMSSNTVSMDDLRHYLKVADWKERVPGDAGALWDNVNGEGQDFTIAVPTVIPPDSVEWRSVIERLAAFELLSVAQVVYRLQNQFVDVTRFRAANDYVIHESIPLTAGVGLIGAAYKMLRASATTARRPRGHIAGDFSKIGDQIVAHARLGQTEKGSYVLPVLMPLTKAELPVLEGFSQLGVFRVAPEPNERRVTRTLAQALTAIQTYIVQPAQEPKSAEMPYLVAAGASRELVMAVHEILNDPAVATFEASFGWASGITKPAAVPSEVRVPSDARELLTIAARLLSSSKREPNQSVSGPIVEVRHLPDDPVGEVALQTVRKGRQVEIRVRLNRDQLDPALEWMRTSRTIVVNGPIQRVPGRPLRIDIPTNIYPLDDDYLPRAVQ